MDKIKFNCIMDDFYKNRGGIDEIYEYYSSQILLHLTAKFQHCGEEFAKDVAQDFFAYLFDAEKKIPQIESPTAWVYAVCDNLARKKLKSDGGRGAAVSYEEDFQKDFYEKSEIDRLIDTADLQDVFRSLQPDERQILVLKIWQGYSLKEISERLRLSYAAVRQIYCRTLKRLRRIAALPGVKPNEC